MLAGAAYTAEFLARLPRQAFLHRGPRLSGHRHHRVVKGLYRHAVDALVRDYEDSIPGLHLPDPDDRHVVAAAIRGRADVIVTANMRDDPAETLAPLGIEVQRPDEFVLHLLDLAPGIVAEAARNHRESLKHPPKTVDEYLNRLEAQGLTQTVSVLREHNVLSHNRR